MRHQLLVAFTFVVFLIASTTITTADVTDGLMAYWPLDDGAGSVASDSTGNGHDGALENGPKWVLSGEAEVGAGALSFDGVDDRIVVESFDVEGSGITIAAWLKLDGYVDDARVISKSEGGGTGDHYWALVLSGNGEDDLQFRLRTDVGATTKVQVPDGQELELGVWIHVAITWDASDPNIRFYKNGVEIHSASKDGTAVGVGAGVKVGVGNQSVSAGEGSMDRPFHGTMDDVAIWNRGLTQPEIAELLSTGVAAAVEPGRKLTTAWGAIKH